MRLIEKFQLLPKCVYMSLTKQHQNLRLL